MGNKKLKLFGKILFYGIFGIVTGIIIGGIFGLLIAYIAGLFNTLPREEVPLQLGVFLGMGAGAMIGGIFCGIIGYKD